MDEPRLDVHQCLPRPAEEHGHLADIEGATRLMLLDTVAIVKDAGQWLAVVSDEQAMVVWHCPFCGVRLA